MSGFEGHTKGGIVAAGIYILLLLIIQVFSTSFAWVEFPIFIGLCLFGALWPDTDVGSTSRIIIYVLFFIIDVLLIFVFKYYLEAALFGLFTMLPAVSKHRGWTHSNSGHLSWVFHF